MQGISPSSVPFNTTQGTEVAGQRGRLRFADLD
jgi:hypothetical protein